MPESSTFCVSGFRGSLRAIASDTNIRWYLDALISRSIFNDRVKLKGDSMLRGAVMNLLDGLIYAGSSVAFQLRDDFVTPSSSLDESA